MPILEVEGQTPSPGASWESRSERIKLIGPRAAVRLEGESPGYEAQPLPGL